MWDALHVVISVAVVLLAWILLSRDLSGWSYSRRFALMASVLVGATTISILDSGWGSIAMFVGAGVIGGYLSMSYYGNNHSSPYSLLSILVIVCGVSVLLFSFGLVITDDDSEIPSLNYLFIAMCQSVTMISISGGMVLFGRAEDMELKKTVAAKGGLWKWLVAGLAIVALVLIVLMSILPVKSPIFLSNALISWLIGWVLFSSINIEENKTSAIAPLLTGMLGMSVALLGVASADRIITVLGGMTSGMCLRTFWMEDSSLGRKLAGLFSRARAGSDLGDESDATSDEDSPNKSKNKRKLPKNVQGITPEEAAARIVQSHRVLIIPGTGFAVADAREEFQAFLESLQKSNVAFRFGIHPSAGRKPGEVANLFAEITTEGVEAVSEEMATTRIPLTTAEDIQKAAIDSHLVLAIGANDIVNPDLKPTKSKPDPADPETDLENEAATETKSEAELLPAPHTEETTNCNTPQPIELLNGPPVIVLKRSLDNGYADKRNPLFATSNCFLLLDDIPQSIFEIDSALRTRFKTDETSASNV